MGFISSWCCPEGLKCIKIDESTALIHGPGYPGKQFIQVIIISAGHCYSQTLKVSCRTHCHNDISGDISVYVTVSGFVNFAMVDTAF